MVASNDFSAFALFTAGLATIVNAAGVAKGDTPSGNPIYTPGLNEIVPAGSQYNITWQNTTPGTVSIYYCIGPSVNCVNQNPPIADSIPNNGNCLWTPPTSLIPTGNSGFGIQVVVDATGEFQYSSQFGISNSNPSPNGYSSASATPTGYGYGNSTTTTDSSVYVAPTGAPADNSSVIYPTQPLTVPSTLQSYTPTYGGPSATNSKPAAATASGAAGKLSAGVGMAVGAMVAAFAL